MLSQDAKKATAQPSTEVTPQQPLATTFGKSQLNLPGDLSAVGEPRSPEPVRSSAGLESSGGVTIPPRTPAPKPSGN